MGVSTGTFFNSSRARENESDSGNILKVESTGFADRSGMNVRERKKIWETLKILSLVSGKIELKSKRNLKETLRRSVLNMLGLRHSLDIQVKRMKN